MIKKHLKDILTSIAGLVHVNDLNCTTQILVFPCQTCSVYALKQFGHKPKMSSFFLKVNQHYIIIGCRAF